MHFHWAMYVCFFFVIWSALEGGVFKAFSEFIMTGLARAKAAAGIESMQQINRTVLRTEFVAALFLITILSMLFAIYSVLNLEGLPRITIILAALVYFISVFLVTLLGNVPMNRHLDRLDPWDEAAAVYWSKYSKRWTQLNHFRTFGSIVTAILYLISGVSLVAA